MSERPEKNVNHSNYIVKSPCLPFFTPRDGLMYVLDKQKLLVTDPVDTQTT